MSPTDQHVQKSTYASQGLNVKHCPFPRSRHFLYIRTWTSKRVYDRLLCVHTFYIWAPCTFFFLSFFFFANLKIDTSSSTLALKPSRPFSLFRAVWLLLPLTSSWCIWRICDDENEKKLGCFICCKPFKRGLVFAVGLFPVVAPMSPPAEPHISHPIKGKKKTFLNIKNLEVHMAASLHGSDIKDHSVYFWSAVSTRWEKASGTQKRLTSSGALRKIFFKNVLAISWWRKHDPSLPPKHLQPVPQV